MMLLSGKYAKDGSTRPLSMQTRTRKMTPTKTHRPTDATSCFLTPLLKKQDRRNCSLVRVLKSLRVYSKLLPYRQLCLSKERRNTSASGCMLLRFPSARPGTFTTHLAMLTKTPISVSKTCNTLRNGNLYTLNTPPPQLPHPIHKAFIHIDPVDNGRGMIWGVPALARGRWGEWKPLSGKAQFGQWGRESKGAV